MNDINAFIQNYADYTAFLNYMFAEHTGLLEHQLHQWETVICDDDITYLNTHMGTYIFNSESLWNKQTKDLPAAKESDDYYKTSELI